MYIVSVLAIGPVRSNHPFGVCAYPSLRVDWGAGLRLSCVRVNAGSHPYHNAYR